MNPPDRLWLPDEALDAVLAHVQLQPVERLPLDRAGGRVLAEPLIAQENIPPFRASTMDGFAVVAADVTTVRRIIGDQFAGQANSSPVTRGTAVRIMTGAPLPAGADAVVPVENVEVRDGEVVIRQPAVQSGRNVRPVGADIAEGEAVLSPGSLLGPAEVGLLASLGYITVAVRRRPRVSILSTGNELVDPEEIPGPGQIRDANRFALTVAVESAGAEVSWNGRAADDWDGLRDLIADRIDESDVVITSGGVSVGDRDFVEPLLNDLAHVHFRRLLMKPGKPLTFATRGRTLVFGLPGNPVSALVGFEIFVRSALRAMLGEPEARPRPAIARLEHDVMTGDRIEFQRAALRVDDEGCLLVRNTGSQGSARLASFVGANALLILPPGNRGYRRGERVRVLVLRPIAGSLERLA